MVVRIPVACAVAIPMARDKIRLVPVRNVRIEVVVNVIGLMPGCMHSRAMAVAVAEIVRPGEIVVPNLPADLRSTVDVPGLVPVTSPASFDRNFIRCQCSQNQSEHEQSFHLLSSVLESLIW